MKTLVLVLSTMVAEEEASRVRPSKPTYWPEQLVIRGFLADPNYTTKMKYEEEVNERNAPKVD